MPDIILGIQWMAELKKIPTLVREWVSMVAICLVGQEPVGISLPTLCQFEPKREHCWTSCLSYDSRWSCA